MKTIPTDPLKRPVGKPPRSKEAAHIQWRIRATAEETAKARALAELHTGGDLSSLIREALSHYALIKSNKQPTKSSKG
jgi:hypothetical protein